MARILGIAASTAAASFVGICMYSYGETGISVLDGVIVTYLASFKTLEFTM